eukprot:8484044-Prorocentrum_lima.AAC.1
MKERPWCRSSHEVIQPATVDHASCNMAARDNHRRHLHRGAMLERDNSSLSTGRRACGGGGVRRLGA